MTGKNGNAKESQHRISFHLKADFWCSLSVNLFGKSPVKEN
jgi:hypothetical protein